MQEAIRRSIKGGYKARKCEECGKNLDTNSPIQRYCGPRKENTSCAYKVHHRTKLLWQKNNPEYSRIRSNKYRRKLLTDKKE